MKRLYWTAAGATRWTLLALALLAAGLLVLVEQVPKGSQAEGYELKLAAALEAQEAFDAIRAERPRRGLPPFEAVDKAQTGLIGPPGTDITTASGSVVAKRTTANPNFAAVIVEMLRRLELAPGDTLAIGYSGSFPALNVCVLAAVDTLQLNPLIIASAASSDYGASSPAFTWLDMETLLQQQGIFRAKSLAASVGGIEDQGIGLSKTGRESLLQSVQRNGVALLEPRDFEDSLTERMRLYEAAAQGRRIAAYVNVGGGTVSVGRSRGKTMYKVGINRPGPKAPVDSIIGRFLDKGIPVLHLVRVEDLARQFGLPVAPSRQQVPGTGQVFGRTRPEPWLVGGALALLVAVLGYIAVRSRRAAQLQSSADEGEPRVEAVR